MENSNETPLDPDDDLQASNELLRLKLELDHHMIMSGSSSELPPEVEHEWLKNIYDFEKQCKEAGKAMVYDILGRPPFKPYHELTREELRSELERLKAMMEAKGMGLDFCCEYDDEVIYRFITEELFEHETDAFLMEGMFRHFTYEEFHPNHDYDLRRYTLDFFEHIMERKWDDHYHGYYLSDKMTFQGKELSASMVSEILLAFQEAHTRFECKRAQIENVQFDLETGKGTVAMNIGYVAHPHQGMARIFEGTSKVSFNYSGDYWLICGFEFPGLSGGAKLK